MKNNKQRKLFHIKINKDTFTKWNRGKVIYCVLMTFFIGMFLFAATALIKSQLDYKKGKDTYKSLADDYVKVDDSEDNDKDIVWPSFYSGDGDEATAQEEVVEFQKLDVDFEHLKKINEDIIGWIYCTNTVINYPVVQGSDNDYYLKHLFNKKSNNSGSIFLDSLNDSGFKDDNSIIYGHHMKYGSMFGSLEKYKKQSYYNEHPYLYLLTKKQDYRIELFSGYVTEYDSDTYTLSFADDNENQKYLDDVISKSTFKSKIKVTVDDKIVTLSTCSYDFDNARYVVHGKLVPIYSAKKELYPEEYKE